MKHKDKILKNRQRIKHKIILRRPKIILVLGGSYDISLGLA